MLISVHLPKTAGSSFLAALEQNFGERLLKDYDDRPITRSVLARNIAAAKGSIVTAALGGSLSRYDCIHGHFMPLKYRWMRADSAIRFVTWMRHPVERLGSHYFHWMRVAPPTHASAIRRRVYAEQWSLERFCLAPEFRNIYRKYLWGFPLDHFDFVGITEYFDAEMRCFSNMYMNVDLPVRRENINLQRESATYVDDRLLRARIEKYHTADMALYNRALQLRQLRLG
jgi:hypothetical protein